METFEMGDNLKAIRKAKNLTVPEVLRKLKKHGIDISGTTFYAWEEGTRPIPHKYILPLCMCLEVTIDFLYVINNKSPLLNEKVNNIKSIEAFLRNLDDNTCVCTITFVLFVTVKLTRKLKNTLILNTIRRHLKS